MNKMILIFLTLLFFKPFGLDQVDKFGLNTLSMFAATKIFRILWIILIVVFILYLIYKLYIYSRKKMIKIEVSLFGFLFSILYIYFLTTSFITSDYIGLLGVYRSFELSVIIISIFILTSIKSFQNLNLIDLMQKAILINFYIIVIVILFWLLKDISMIFQLETQGRLRLGGAVYSPNELGIIATVSIWSAYYLLFSKGINKSFFLFTILIALLIIVLTNSRTSIAIALGSILFMLYKQNLISKIIIISMAFVGTILLFTTFSIDYLGYGNDPIEELKTLNNRTVIYQVAFDGIADNPWFGTGYVEGPKEFLKENFTQDFWLPPHTHNGYIEIALSLGIPFFVIFILLSLGLLYSSIKNVLFSTSGLILASSMQLIIIMMTAMTTVIIGNTINPFFILFLFHLLTNGKLLQNASYKLRSKENV